MKRRINLLREFSIPLIAGVLLALFWANLNPATYHSFVEQPHFAGFSLHFISNELFMVLFFGIAAVEITQSCLPGGSLNPPSKAINPLFGTVGGIIGPVAVYILLNSIWGSKELFNGWGIPTATDIALAWLAARMVFGAGHPAVSYLLLLAVADDAIGLIIIAVFYPNPNLPAEPIWLLLTLAGMLAAYLLRRSKIQNYWPYLLTGGVMSWVGLHNAHLHPALALVFIVPFLPHAARESGLLFEEDPSDTSPLHQFEHEWKVIVDFGLLIFGLANAGVEFSSIGPVTWIVLSSLIIGKAVGIFGFGWAAKKLGFELPKGMRKRELLVAGIIAGTGFTVALFVSGEAFTNPEIKGAAKMGAMFSLVAAFIGVAMGRLLKIKKVE
jgi:Na+:H+ antiporter, NhaA family